MNYIKIVVKTTFLLVCQQDPINMIYKRYDLTNKASNKIILKHTFMAQNIDNVGNLYYIVRHNHLQGGHASKLPKLILLLVNGVCMILV
jgi:hypothetical protein